MLIRSPKELALFMASYRKKSRLSQKKISEKTGLKQSTISAFENKPDSTKLATFFEIFSVLNLEFSLCEKQDFSKGQTTWQEPW